MVRLRCVVALALMIGSASSATAQSAPDQSSALPLDLAFDTRQFLWGGGPALSPDGGKVAYSVRQTPPDMNLDARYQTNGTPSSVVGSRVFLSPIEGGASSDICPAEGNCWRPSWSPDATQIAFYSDAGGYPQLWVYDVQAEDTRRVSSSRIKAKLWAGDHARWSPDGRTLYVPLSPDQSAEGDFSSFTAAADGGPEEAMAPGAATVTVLGSGSESQADPAAAAAPPMAEHMLFENNATLAAVDVEAGRVTSLVSSETTPRPSVLRVSASGQWLSYLSVFKPGDVTSQVTTYDLAVVPTAGGGVIVVAEDLPVGNDYHGENYSWHPTDDLLVYRKDDALWLVDLSEGRPAEPSRLGAELGPITPVPLWFSRDGDAVAVGLQPHDPEDYFGSRPRALGWIPLDGSTPSQAAWGEEWEFQRMVRANETTLWQPEDDVVSVLLRDEATGESAIASVDFDDTALSVRWRGIARLRGFASVDHERVVAFYEDVGTPPDVYSFTDDFSTRERTTAIDTRLDEVARPKAEIIETDVPLHDGTIGSVRTAVLLPPGAERGDRLPAVVMIYPGGDVTRHVEQFGGGRTVTVPTNLFVSRGYAVVLVDLRLGPSAEAGNPMQEMVDVLLPQVYRAAELGYIDITRVGITGQSFGGYGTGSIISRTNLFRAAVAISGIYDLGGTYGHMGDGYTSFWVGWAEGGQARMGTHPWADVRRYMDNSPYYQADKIRTPLLLVHGDEDMAYHDAEKLFSALRRLGRDAQLAVYHGQGHVVFDWSQPNAIDAGRRMIEFFDRYLKERMVG